MKKVLLVFMLVLGLSMGVVGCGSTVGDLPYEILKEVPAEAQELIEKKGYQLLKIGSDQVLVIQAGEKPSLGYGIEVSSVKVTSKEITVNTTETKPGEDQLVGMALSYPAIAIKITEPLSADLAVKLDGVNLEKLNK